MHELCGKWLGEKTLVNWLLNCTIIVKFHELNREEFKSCWNFARLWLKVRNLCNLIGYQWSDARQCHFNGPLENPCWNQYFLFVRLNAVKSVSHYRSYNFNYTPLMRRNKSTCIYGTALLAKWSGRLICGELKCVFPNAHKLWYLDARQWFGFTFWSRLLYFVIMRCCASDGTICIYLLWPYRRKANILASISPMGLPQLACIPICNWPNAKGKKHRRTNLHFMIIETTNLVISFSKQYIVMPSSRAIPNIFGK